MPTIDEVCDLVREETSYLEPMEVYTSLQGDIGVYGDDMDSLLSAYAKRFSVDMSGYRWYFHTGEEGNNFGGLIFPPPNARVEEIPISIGMLHRFAELGRWSIDYPPHTQRSRFVIRINQLIVLSLLATLCFFCLRSCADPGMGQN